MFFWYTSESVIWIVTFILHSIVLSGKIYHSVYDMPQTVFVLSHSSIIEIYGSTGNLPPAICVCGKSVVVKVYFSSAQIEPAVLVLLLHCCSWSLRLRLRFSTSHMHSVQFRYSQNPLFLRGCRTNHTHLPPRCYSWSLRLRLRLSTSHMHLVQFRCRKCL